MWTVVAELKDIAEGKPVVVTIGDQPIGLFNISGKIFAIDNGCMHRGGPLAEGHVEGKEVTCPWHAWAFNLETGACAMNPELTQKTFPVKIEHGKVSVETA